MKIVRAEAEYLEKNSSTCNFFHDKAYMDYPGIKRALLH